MSRKNKQSNLEVTDIEALTFDAMRETGLIPPMTTEDVEQLEAELDEIELPFGPSDPMVLLEGLKTPPSMILPTKAKETETARNLACAARCAHSSASRW